MTPKYSVIDAVSRLFPGYDRKQAEHAIHFLEQCGYRIVPAEDEATLVPKMPDEREQARSTVAARYPLG